MNVTTLERPDVAAYLDAVRSRLADLPAEERDDLVADVEASLLESGEPPRLSPQEFAAELREAAGLSPEATAAPPHAPLDSLRSWLTSERVASWRSTARELAPIWWVARAYVFVVLLALVTGQDWPVGSGIASYPISFDIVVLVVAGAISIWLGLRAKRGPQPYRRVRFAANVALAFALLPVGAYSLSQLDYASLGGTLVYVEPEPGLAMNGLPVRNLYAYSREGTPLFDVLLYDESGRPISVLSDDDSSRRVLTDVNGIEIFNSFPIRYFEPGTRTVARPELAPPVTVPNVATPPLVLPPK